MKVPERGTTRKDGKLVKMQIHFYFKKGCLSNVNFEIYKLIVPELYSYNTIDIKVIKVRVE